MGIRLFFWTGVLLAIGCSKKVTATKTTEPAVSSIKVPAPDSTETPIDSITGSWKIVAYEEGGKFIPLDNIVQVTIGTDFIIKKDKSLSQTFTFTRNKNTLTLYKGSEAAEVVIIEKFSENKLTILSDYTGDRLRLLMIRD